MSTSNPFVESDDERWFDPAPAWWALSLGLFDQAVSLLLSRNTAAGIVAIDRLGRHAHAMGLVPPPARSVECLFPGMSRDVAEGVARVAAGLRFKNRAAIALLQHKGIDALARLVEPPRPRLAAIASSPRGCVVLAFHVGAQFGIGATFHHLGRQTLTVRNLPVGTAHERARALKEAVDAIKDGAIVIAAVDGPGGASTHPLRCCGRRIVLRRGPFVLARLASAPLVPAVAQWTAGGRIVADAGEPLDDDGLSASSIREDRAAAAAAAWLERHVTAHPGDLWPYTLANLAATSDAHAM